MGLLVKSVLHTNTLFAFLNQNLSCGYSKKLSELEGSFEQPKHMLKSWVRYLHFYTEKNVYLNLCNIQNGYWCLICTYPGKVFLHASQI